MAERRRKLSLKAERLSKPTSKAISATPREPCNSALRAAATRARVSNSAGVVW